MKTEKALLSLLLAAVMAFSLNIAGRAVVFAAEPTIYDITVLNLDNEETSGKI